MRVKSAPILIIILLFSTIALAQEPVMDIYNAGMKEGYKKGYDAGFEKGYRQAVDDFKEIFKEKLTEYKSLEAGKFLLQNWYISYPKVYQVTTEKGMEVVIEGCSVLRPFDDLSAEIMKKIPHKDSLNSLNRSNRLKIRPEVEMIPPVMKTVSKKYIQEVQRHGYQYINTPESDYIVVFFDNDREAEKFCVIYGCK